MATDMNDMERDYNRRLEKDFKEKLKGKAVRLSYDELKKRITQFLETHVICTLATCSQDMPRSTIVRYRARGLTVYILTEGGGKIKNIRNNTNVSGSVCGEYSGFQSVTGLQFWGKAAIIAPHDGSRYEQVRKLLDVGSRTDLQQAGVTDIPDMYIIQIEIHRARFLSFPEGILNQVLQVERKE